jgi:hypothetical protein
MTGNPTGRRTAPAGRSLAARGAGTEADPAQTTAIGFLVRRAIQAVIVILGVIPLVQLLGRSTPAGKPWPF